MLALRLDDAGEVIEQFLVPELDGTHGRIRSLRQGVDGALYATTDNGFDGPAAPHHACGTELPVRRPAGAPRCPAAAAGRVPGGPAPC